MLFKKKRKYKKKTSKQKEQKELDEIWAKKVKDRDNWTCQICNKKFDKVNAHHILPRQLKGLRWDVNNGITLCAYHHRLGPWSAHQNAVWFFGWLNENKPQTLRYIINKISQYEKVII